MPDSNAVVEADSDLSGDDVQAKLKSLENLRPFPATATQILTECEKADADVKVITQLIECEPAIGTKVLALANSPLYGTSRPIATIGHATVVIGFRNVSQMALAVAAGEVFSQGDPVVAVQREQTFRQSLACGAVARTVARQMGLGAADEAFLGGVVHDIGKLAFFDVVPEAYVEILNQYKDGQSTEHELNLFGVEHAGIGKSCGTRWGLPPRINTAIRNHHADFRSLDHDLSKSVLIANYFARQWELGFGEAEKLPPSDELEELMSQKDVASLQDECTDQFQAIIEICGAG